MNITRHDDEFCCSEFDLICVGEGELADTYGGDYTYKDTFVCKKCRRAFYRYYGCGRFEGVEEETEKREVESLLSLSDKGDVFVK